MRAIVAISRCDRFVRLLRRKAQADGDFRVTLLGTASPAAAGQPLSVRATLVEAGGQVLLFDAGRGRFRSAWARSKVPIGRIGVLFLNAFSLRPYLRHSGCLADGVARARSSGGGQQPFRVIGPTGTKELMANLEKAYALDVKIRTEDEKLSAGKGIAVVAEDFQADGVVYEKDGREGDGLRSGSRRRHQAGFRLPHRLQWTFGGHFRATNAPTQPQRLSNTAPARDPVDPRGRDSARPRAGLGAFRQGHPRSSPPVRRMSGGVFAEAKPKLAAYTHLGFSSATSRCQRRRVDDVVAQTARRTYGGPLEVGEDLTSLRDRRHRDRAPVEAIVPTARYHAHRLRVGPAKPRLDNAPDAHLFAGKKIKIRLTALVSSAGHRPFAFSPSLPTARALVCSTSESGAFTRWRFGGLRTSRAFSNRLPEWSHADVRSPARPDHEKRASKRFMRRRAARICDAPPPRPIWPNAFSRPAAQGQTSFEALVAAAADQIQGRDSALSRELITGILMCGRLFWRAAKGARSGRPEWSYALLRACSAIITSAVPPKIMLMPTSRPERPGPPSPAGSMKIITARAKSTMAADQHPFPAARQLLTVLERIHDGEDAFEHEKKAISNNVSENRSASPGSRAAREPARGGEQGGDERPPEAGRPARPRRS